MPRKLFLLSTFLIALSCFGCGGGNDSASGFGLDPVFGTPVSGIAETGTVVFNFTRPQAAAPSSTTRLSFLFQDPSGNTLLNRTVSFATLITISDVPISATVVEITALNDSGDFLASLTTAVNITADLSTTIDLANLAFTPQFDSVRTTFSNGTDLELGQSTDIISLESVFTDGSTRQVSLTEASIVIDNESVLELRSGNQIFALLNGSTFVRISVTVEGVTQTEIVPLVVGQGANVRFETEPATGLDIPGVSPARLEKLIVLYTPPFEPEREIEPSDPRLGVSTTPEEALIKDEFDQPLLFEGRLVVNFDDITFLRISYDDPVIGEQIGAFAFFTSQN